MALTIVFKKNNLAQVIGSGLYWKIRFPPVILAKLIILDIISSKSYQHNIVEIGRTRILE